MKMRSPGWLAGLCVLITAVPAWGQGSFNGYMFGDAYYLAAHDDGDAADDLAGANGLWFRRIYLTFDWTFNDAWSTRLRTEMNSPGDFRTKARLAPEVKDAYVQWQKGNHQVTLGLSGTPTFAVVEDVWGYRAVEKTLVDLQRLGPSRDIGVAVQGSFDPQKIVRYNLMLANGNSNSSETNEGKKVLLSVGLFPNDHLVLEGYADYDNLPGDNDWFTVQGFVGVRRVGGRVGVQYVMQSRDVAGADRITLSGLSIFGAVTLTDKAHAFARYDRMLDPNPEADQIAYLPFHPGFESNMVLAGLDVQPHPQVHLMPNVQAVFYGGDGPDPTILPRLTFWIIFK